MSKQEMLLLLDGIIEADPGTLTGAELLEDTPAWDSLAIIVFQAEMDEKFGAEIEPLAIARCSTFDDLMGLVGDRVAA